VELKTVAWDLSAYGGSAQVCIDWRSELKKRSYSSA